MSTTPVTLPQIPGPTQGAAWERIASEGQTVEVPAESTVRYGASFDDRYIERAVSGLVTASNAFFGSDPARGTPKGLWLMQVAPVEPPAPTPAPQPVPPTMPVPGDPLFDQKARVYEAWQRDEGMKIQREKIAALHANERASRDLLAWAASQPQQPGA